jgi:hypothetical protein
MQVEPEGSKEPKCVAHRLRITACVPCCVRIFEEAGSMGDVARHSWAMAHVYLPKEAW